MEPKLDIENVREDQGKNVEYVRKKSRRRKKKRKIWIRILSVILLLLAVMIGTGTYLIISGKQQIAEKGNASRPELKPVKTETVEIKTEILDEDTLKYQGVRYRYNEDMINLLFVGVDSEGTLSAQEGEERDAGQADVIFLASMDNKHKKLTLIPVNRDTITEISIYDENGKFVRKQKEQVALSYAYGNSEQESAELTQEAVSNLFYGLPIHGYYVVNMGAIPIVNDMVGGVEVSLLEDFTEIDASYVKGQKVLLTGNMAETYVRMRYNLGDGSNAARMERQKQYITSLAGKAIAAVKADMTLPVTLYQTIADYMVTDISVNEFSYLATQAVQYSIADDFIRSIAGTSEIGDVYAEFQVDEKALYELILDVFYEKVPE